MSEPETSTPPAASEPEVSEDAAVGKDDILETEVEASAGDGEAESVKDVVESAKESIAAVEKEVEISGEEVAAVEPEAVETVVESAKEAVAELEKEVEKLVAEFQPLAPVEKLESAFQSLIKSDDHALPTSDKSAGEPSEPADVEPETSEISRSVDAQEEKPPATAAPPPRASWANCCGLLELLTSKSNR